MSEARERRHVYLVAPAVVSVFRRSTPALRRSLCVSEGDHMRAAPTMHSTVPEQSVVIRARGAHVDLLAPAMNLFFRRSTPALRRSLRVCEADQIARCAYHALHSARTICCHRRAMGARRLACTGYESVFRRSTPALRRSLCVCEADSNARCAYHAVHSARTICCPYAQEGAHVDLLAPAMNLFSDVQHQLCAGHCASVKLIRCALRLPCTP